MDFKPKIGYSLLGQSTKAKAAFITWIALIGLAIGAFFFGIPLLYMAIFISVIILVLLIIAFTATGILIPIAVLIILGAVVILPGMLLLGIGLIIGFILAPLVHMLVSGIDGFVLGRGRSKGRVLMSNEAGFFLALPGCKLITADAFIYNAHRRSTPEVSRTVNALTVDIRRLEKEPPVQPEPVEAPASPAPVVPAAVMPQAPEQPLETPVKVEPVQPTEAPERMVAAEGETSATA